MDFKRMQEGEYGKVCRKEGEKGNNLIIMNNF